MESDAVKIEQLVKFSHECADVLRQSVIQFEEVNDGRYRANITKDTHLMDNTEFKENVSRKELMSARFKGNIRTKKNKKDIET